jgi:hypothetical protein
MRTAIVIGILGLALTSEGAAAQTAVEQAQILRDFEEPLEYRLVFNDLVIRDARRDVIIAVLRDAFGAVTTR